jgi:hypothetical protein
MALNVKHRIPRRGRYDRLPQRTFKKVQRRRFVRRLITSGAILAVIAIIGGFVYTWYMGQHQTTTISKTPARVTRPSFVPPKISSTVRLGAAVEMLTTPVTPGSNVSLTVRTNAGAICTIQVKYGSAISKDSGLVQKTADEFGVITWAWTVEPSTPKGSWPITVTCKNKKYSAVVADKLVVK